ncbi:putative tsa family protein [Diplodia seriata]|nr:putative tsa family protein [Diplodia seriata]
MLAARRIPAALPRLVRPRAAQFHASARAHVRVGDAVPDVELMEASPGNKLSIAKQLKGKGLPLTAKREGPACSSSHVPGYISHPKLSTAGQVFVVSVNDPFVMKAWGDVLDPAGKSGIRFIADPAGAFTKALDLSFDSRAIFGNERSKRYALVIEDGKVKEAHVEPDNTGVDVSAANKVLG